MILYLIFSIIFSVAISYFLMELRRSGKELQRKIDEYQNYGCQCGSHIYEIGDGGEFEGKEMITIWCAICGSLKGVVDRKSHPNSAYHLERKK